MENNITVYSEQDTDTMIALVMENHNAFSEYLTKQERSKVRAYASRYFKGKLFNAGKMHLLDILGFKVVQKQTWVMERRKI